MSSSLSKLCCHSAPSFTFGLFGLFLISQSASQVWTSRGEKQQQTNNKDRMQTGVRERCMGYLWSLIHNDLAPDESWALLCVSVYNVYSAAFWASVRVLGLLCYSHRGPQASACRALSVHSAVWGSKTWTGSLEPPLPAGWAQSRLDGYTHTSARAHTHTHVHTHTCTHTHVYTHKDRHPPKHITTQKDAILILQCVSCWKNG